MACHLPLRGGSGNVWREWDLEQLKSALAVGSRRLPVVRRAPRPRSRMLIWGGRFGSRARLSRQTKASGRTRSSDPVRPSCIAPYPRANSNHPVQLSSPCPQDLLGLLAFMSPALMLVFTVRLRTTSFVRRIFFESSCFSMMGLLVRIGRLGLSTFVETKPPRSMQSKAHSVGSLVSAPPCPASLPFVRTSRERACNRRIAVAWGE